MLISDNIYYIPEGKRTIFSGKKANISIDEATNRLEIVAEGISKSIDMSTTRVKSSLGKISFPIFQGEKRSYMAMMTGPWIYVFNPLANILGALPGMFKRTEARTLATKLNSYSKLPPK